MKKEMKVFDKAFLLATTTHNDASRKSARRRFENDHPEIEGAEIDRAWAAACALERSCYGFGDRCRLKWISDDEALVMVQTLFPGFSKSTYRTALRHGYVVSR